MNIRKFGDPIRKFEKGGKSNNLTLPKGNYTINIHGDTNWLGESTGSRIAEIKSGNNTTYVELSGKNELLINGNPRILRGTIMNQSSDPNSDLAKKYRSKKNITGFNYSVR